jgi:hypothetical protein
MGKQRAQDGEASSEAIEGCHEFRQEEYSEQEDTKEG